MNYSDELEAIIKKIIESGDSELLRDEAHKQALIDGEDPDEVDIIIKGRLHKATPPSVPVFLQSETPSASSRDESLQPDDYNDSPYTETTASSNLYDTQEEYYPTDNVRKYSVIGAAVAAVAAVIVLCVMFFGGNKATILTADKDVVTTKIQGEKGTIIYTTDADEIELTHVPDWVTVSLNGKVLQYDIKLNTTNNNRRDSIVVKAGDLTCSVEVRQNIKASYIKFDKDEVLLPKEGGAVSVNVDVDSDSPLFIDNEKLASVSGKVITIKASLNTNPEEWTKIITVKCDDISSEIKVTQESNVCSYCKGEGHLDSPCSLCGGLGAHGYCGYTGKEPCPKCQGTGMKYYEY